MLATCIVALIVGCAGIGLAVRAGVAPPFELWLTPDDRHVLVARNGPACLPDLLRIACIAGVTRREFRVVYVSLLTHWDLLSFPVPSY
jgi:hypothetical protein